MDVPKPPQHLPDNGVVWADAVARVAGGTNVRWLVVAGVIQSRHTGDVAARCIVNARIRRIGAVVLALVMIIVDLDVERLLRLGDGARDFDVEVVLSGVKNGESVRAEEVGDRLHLL